MRTSSLAGRTVACAATLAMLSGTARAGDDRDPRPAARVPDVVLVDRDGRSVRFRSDVLGGRVVVIDFVFTTCTTICPLLSSTFARLQERLGDRLARDVQIVSVSLDPVRDTPERLRAYAARHHAGPHWSWLTGPSHDVETVLKALGAYTPDASAHTPVVLVGDARTGVFERFNGFPNPERLVARVDELLAARSHTASRERM
ncbi:MAG TPA: SCO family protein [Myxococcales bacterium]|jgi:protein SCO1/2|nr:SCO family protein [Myxococcales bacterium]